MKILLEPFPVLLLDVQEIVDAHECTRALHGADPVVLTQCGMCSYSLGVRQVGDLPDHDVHACPDCGALNQAR